MTVPSKWVRTQSDELAIDQGYGFDLKRAERVRRFLSSCCRQSIGDWAGKGIELMTWQWEDIVAPLYGWIDPSGNRRYRSLSCWIPKNNGKSTLCSGLCLYHLIGDNEKGAFVVNVASTIEQASICYRSTAGMVAQMKERDQSLTRILKDRANLKTIEYKPTLSFLKVMSGDKGGGKSGFPISMLCIDETAEIKNRLFYESMMANARKRKRSLAISISTAGFSRENNIGFEEFCYSQDVIAGKRISLDRLCVIYAASPDEPWDDIETARKCNPGWNITIDPQEVRASIEEAKNEPRKTNAYRTYRTNVWTGSAINWVAPLAWAACGESFDESRFHNQSCHIGYDISYRHDFASYVLVTKQDDLVYLLPRFFLPKKLAERRTQSEKLGIMQWASEPKNNLYLIEGDTIDPAFIRQKIKEDSEKFVIEDIRYDPTGLEESRQLLEEEGFNCVPIPQRPRFLAPPAGYLERLVLAKRLRHPNNPILNFMLENCAIKETVDGVHVCKGKGEQGVIDGIIASLMGLHGLLASEENAFSFDVM